MKYIHTPKAPKAVGPYSQAIQLDNGFLYVSGQIGLDPNTMELKSDLKGQTEQIFANISEILLAAGYTRNDVIKTTIILEDIKDFSEVNNLYENFFENHKPARSTFAVKNLPKNSLIEIEVIAFK
ncbi:RidA family protein [Spiroplasma apis]|uniref:TdcF protein n=1 Tax=Spiroplasma apis B31 TaxID=1276258 RepID=V5RI85_SPIAP|nr:RidA family protein [Spiroplasma apis]AHB36402.1 TdcF protein [Spiroplasma apis B31]